MPSQIGKLKYIFLTLFGVLSIAIVGYGWMYSIPKKKCDAAQGWFSMKTRKCYAPVAISSFTKREDGKADIDMHDDARSASNERAVNAAAASQ